MTKHSSKSAKEIQSEIAATHESERTQHRLDRQFHDVISPKERREGQKEKAKLESELRAAEHRDLRKSGENAA